MLGGFGGHVGVADDRRYAETIGQRAAERRVGVGFRAANVMIQVRQAGEDDFTRGPGREAERRARPNPIRPTPRRLREFPRPRANAWRRNGGLDRSETELELTGN